MARAGTTRPMSDLEFWMVMGGVTVCTSILSGLFGMAGGMLLLAVLLLRFDPLVAIPIHGVIQLASNASRAWFLRQHVSARAVVRFILPLLPAGALGVVLLEWLPPAVGRILIGSFVLFVTWRPTPHKTPARAAAHPERFLPLGGALVGFFSTLVGATGPLLGPFILALELSPQATVATMAACQVFQHASKIAVFGVSGFGLSGQLGPAIGLSVCAALGSALGARWLERVPRDTFKRILRILLTLLSLQLLFSGTWQLLE